MSLRGNGGGNNSGSNNINRSRRGGGGSEAKSTSNTSGGEGRGGPRIFESKSGNNFRHNGTHPKILSATPSILNNAKDIGPVKILQSRRNDDVDGNKKPIAPTILQPPAGATTTAPSAATIPRLAVRPKAESEEKPSQPSGLPPPMPASIRFFDDSNNLNKGFLEFLTSTNCNYHCCAIIGPQSSGKSTFASMFSGNETGDLYGEYIFRPSPREFVEKGASQTVSINVYVTKNRTIVFDCQALNSGHIFELAHRSSRREGIKLSQVVKYFEDETHKFLMILFEICHTIILGIDWFIDLNIIRQILAADLSYRKLKSNYNASSARKINLVIAQLRAKSADFEPETVAERIRMLKGMFDGTRFDVCGGLSMKKLGFDMYSYVDTSVNYVLFAEIKPRSKLDQTPSTEDYSGLLTIPFHETMKKFSLHILKLPRQLFHQQTGKLNEREWFLQIATPAWEKLFSSELTTFSRK